MKNGFALVIALLLVLSLVGCTVDIPVTGLDGNPVTSQQQNEQSTGSVPPDNKEELSADDAAAVAFKHAKTEKNAVSDLEVDLDEDNGTVYYEVSFSAGKYDYEYEVEAYTGKILHHEKEVDD